MKSRSILVVIMFSLCLIFFSAAAYAQSAAPVISANYGLTVENNTSVNLEIQIFSVSASNNFQVTISTSHGKLTITSTDRLSSVVGNGTAIVKITGDLYNINTALSSMTYMPDSGFSGTDMIAVQATDLSASETGSIQVPVKVSDAPIINLPGSKSVLNNSDLDISGISISYPSISSGSLPVTLSASHGILTLQVSSGLAFIKGNGTEKVTMIGSLNDINTTLADLKYHSAPLYAGTDTLTVSANDMGDFGSYTLSPVTAAVEISVLDRPRVIVPLQQVQWSPHNAIENTDLTISGIFIKNDTIGTNNMQVTLAAGHGTIMLGTQSSPVNITGNGTGNITVTGNLTAVNSIISCITYRADGDFPGSDTIAIAALDPGSSASSSGSININKASVNDLLIVAAPQGLSTPNGTVYKIQGFFITCLNPVNDNMQAVISVSHGILSLQNSAGLKYISGNGTGNMTLAGSLANLNSALNALAYTSTKGYTGSESIVVDATDLNTYKSASGTAEINVTASDNPGLPAADAPSDDFNKNTAELSGNNINIKPVLDPVKGTAKSYITADDIAGAVLNAQKDSSGNWYINIAAAPITGVNTYEFSLPSDVLSDPAATIRIKITTPLCTLTIPSSLFFGTDTVGKDALISVSRLDSGGFPVDLKTVIGSRPVIELKATIGGIKAAWNNDATPVRVSIPYSPSAAEAANPEHIGAWCLDDSGTLSPVPNCKYDVLTGTVNFTVAHFGKYALTFANKTFYDLSRYAWAKKQIEAMASRGIISGTSSTTFSPAANITRGDFVKLLVTSLGLTANITDNFSDVNKTAYYYNTVGIAKKLGIASANADGKFKPGEQITRQDMMVMTAKALKIAKPELPAGSSADLSGFSDRNKIPLGARDYVGTLVKNRIISGAGGKLNPAQFMSRAEAAVILYGLLQME